MTSGKRFLGIALLCGCTTNNVTEVIEPVDGGDSHEASAEAETLDAPADSGADVSADVEQDAWHPDAAPPEAGRDASSDAGPCTPLTFPLPPPAQCMTNQGPYITAPGRYWFMQSGTYACSSVALAASAACEMCKETYDCACLRPLVGDGGAMCIDGTTGPFYFQ